jgi:LmbE family N-acetylglucosaminyl deacetylase
MSRRFVSALIFALGLLITPAHTQMRVTPVGEKPDAEALGLALRRLNSVGTLMMTTAHPDDENNALLAKYKYQQGIRTTLVTATRGNGGQNEIGPELFEALAALRTEELLAAHRIDGAEQYFARAVDFGFSFSRDETFQKWHRDEILADYVRWIRVIRPDVIIGFLWDPTKGGGQHHQASANITAEAFRAAADPTKFPDQLKAGLKVWQPAKFYYTGGFFGGEKLEGVTDDQICRTDGNEFDPLLGKTYNDIGAEARSMHKCQGMSQLYTLPGPQPRTYVLQDTVLPGEKAALNKDIFAGVDTGVRSLSRFTKGGTPALTKAIETIATQASLAQTTFAGKGAAATVPVLGQVLTTIRGVRAQLATLQPVEAGRYDIDFRLAQKEHDAEEALRLASGLRVDLLADDGLVVGGQDVKLTLRAYTGSSGVAVKSVAFAGFEGAASCAPAAIEGGKPYACETTGKVPAAAKLSTNYWHRLPDRDYYDFDADAPFGLPFQPTPFRATLTLTIAGQDQTIDLPVQSRSEGDIFSGEKRGELLVVPAFAAKLDTSVIAFPGQGQTRELRVTVLNHGKGAAKASVSLDVPAGWKVEPAQAPVEFTREDEALTVRLQVTPPAGVAAGRYTAKAAVASNGKTYDKGYEVIEYPHISRRHLVADAVASLRVLDIQPVQNLTIGYIMGVGDQVPPALAQLGASVDLLTSGQLAWGDLSKYDIIMTGVRAYERREDLKAYNSRLIDYARHGGTVIVQYNKFEFNQAQYGPYPAKVSSNRVTDESAGVKVLHPEHPVFNTPNKVTEKTWQGWVQERGLYFLDTAKADPQYVDLVEMADPFANNVGPRRGALVEAKVGNGRWIYVGLNLWRQLPAGTEGAYTLMANLLSVAKHGTANNN